MSMRDKLNEAISKRATKDVGLLVDKLNAMIKAMEILNNKMNEITDNQVEQEDYLIKILRK